MQGHPLRGCRGRCSRREDGNYSEFINHRLGGRLRTRSRVLLLGNRTKIRRKTDKLRKGKAETGRRNYKSAGERKENEPCVWVIYNRSGKMNRRAHTCAPCNLGGEYSAVRVASTRSPVNFSRSLSPESSSPHPQPSISFFLPLSFGAASRVDRTFSLCQPPHRNRRN